MYLFENIICSDLDTTSFTLEDIREDTRAYTSPKKKNIFYGMRHIRYLLKVKLIAKNEDGTFRVAHPDTEPDLVTALEGDDDLAEKFRHDWVVANRR